VKKKAKYVDMNVEEDRNANVLTELPNRLEDFISDKKQIEVLHKRGVKYLFPIQERCFKPILEGRDLIGKDRTGSGKTLAFGLPIIERFRKEGLLKQLVKK
jgi:superfamily II DNA/RNA helicase